MGKTILSATSICLGILLFAAQMCGAASSGMTMDSGPVMQINRMGHYTATLPDGRAVLFGGHGTNFVSLGTAEIFTQSAYSFELYSMNYVHDAPAFARLADGKYLIAGGADNLGVAPGFPTAEIFNPADNSFTPTTSTMNHGRMTCGAATLKDSTVLIAGGWYDNTSATYGEVYDHTTGTFAATGALNTPRSWPLVVPTDDGKAVMFAGEGIYGTAIKQLVELYNPSDKSFTVLDSNVFGTDTGWTVGAQVYYDRSTDQQKLRGGSYLFFADSAYEYQLFTFDPAAKTFQKVGAPIFDSSFSLTAPIVDSLRNRAYIIKELWGAGGVQTAQVQIACIIVNTNNWTIKEPNGWDTFPQSYFPTYAGFNVLSDGNILMSGGDNQLGYQTNFSPIDSTRILVPDTSIATGLRFVRPASPSAGPYSFRTVAGAIRFHSSLREYMTISLVSVSGKTVARLFNGIIEPAMSYDFSLAGRHCAGGAYYCKLTKATGTKMFKVVLTDR